MTDHPPARRSRVDANRAPFRCMLVIAAATAIVHAVAAQPRLSWMWGVHFYGFYPRWIVVAATLALAGLILALVVRTERVAGALARALAGRRAAAFVAVSIVAGTALFWFARISHTYLGDGNTIVEEIDTSQPLLEREPLSSLLQYAVYRNTKAWFYQPNRSLDLNAQDALAVGSVLAGFLFLVIAWFFARELARLVNDDDDGHARVVAVLVWLVVVTQGYVQLFFGYVENYSFYAVGVLTYLWLALRHLRGAPLLYPTLALMLCFALHLSSSVLGASFLVLVVFALVRRGTRMRALRDLAVGLGVGVGVVFAFSRLHQGYNPLATLVAMARTAFAQESNRGYMFSAPHYRDFTNEQLLIGPLGMFLFLPSAVAALSTPEIRRRPAAWFVLVAGLSFLVACWLIGDSNLGYARDWDVLSHSGLVFTSASLVLLLLARRVPRSIMVASLVCAIGTSLYHTVPWIALNADASRSIARLQTLPLGMGRTEVVMSTYYRQRGDTANQRLWLQRALQTNPDNANAMYLLGTLDVDTGHYEEAVVWLERAIRLRPDKVALRMSAVRALYALNRMPEAIAHLEAIVRAEPSNISAQIALGEALGQAGRIAESQRVFGQAELICRPMVEHDADNASITTVYGFILFRLGRLDEAKRQLEKAITLDPRVADPYCFMGYVLRDEGRLAEAREQFEACLTLNPAFGGHREIEDWLAHNRR